MKERLLGYRKRIDTLLEEKPDGTDWEGLLEEHLTQISFFQHERLVHLIVTVTFGLLVMIATAIYCIAQYMAVLPLIVLLLALLIPYIWYYYIIENEVQKMYWQYDSILEMANAQRHKMLCNKN